MADSPSHKLGQIIGYAMEEAFYDMLLPLAHEFGVYIDRQGLRQPARKGKFVTWVDDHDNKHNLDFVLERGGSQETIGTPVAFIESAWRRYTKHSVNKAGEIANALVPLRRTYVDNRPFLGALVAGEWTQGGITHMESQAINVLHLPLSTIVDAFGTEGVDVYFEEDTDTEHMRRQIARWNSLGEEGQQRVVAALREKASAQLEEYLDKIRAHLSRKVQSVFILSLHGKGQTVSSVPEALALLSAMEMQETKPDEMEFVRIEIQVCYSNTDQIDASFTNLADAMMWLEKNYATR
ncbi:hypothetical protein G7Y41_06340 [Schaalia sp. ZJ405]|uniref:hypothetical protein n=1 Tax=Schaalia sp. ZJ405 TaxID=2709403 RepID=UPI0013ED258D|nr:hypothetical protein [Schaalia sp. ZJ405]QPK80695.1 hypothetical protein G7Y41_06340 [Schaalia sp. ZJ405]